MPPLRALFLDVDDTLFSTTEFASRARRRAMAAIAAVPGVALSADDLLGELREVIAEFGANYHEHYDRLLRRVPEEGLGGHARAALVAVGVAAYHDAKQVWMEPFPGLLDLLRDLRKAGGVRLGIVTEGLEVKQYEKLVRLGVYPLLDPGAVFVSDAIGISKPNPKLLQKALSCSAVAPGEAIYVGDNPVNDVAPAKSLGMTAVRFRSPGGKHSCAPAPVAPDHEVADFAALRTVLRDVHGIGV